MTDSMREMAALYAIGALDAAERIEVERQLESGDMELAREITEQGVLLGELALGAPSATPPPSIKARLLEQTAKAKQDMLPPGVAALVRDSELGWKKTPWEGVTVKRLFFDPKTGGATHLIKMQPGAVYPSHTHAAPEQCYVLEGDVTFHNYSLRAGDFGVAGAHTGHTPASTVNGCLLLLMNNVHDEIHS